MYIILINKFYNKDMKIMIKKILYKFNIFEILKL